MISLDEFNRAIDALRRHPVPLNGQPLDAHISWSEECSEPEDPDNFATEAIYVICNSGMRHQPARIIFDRCCNALLRGEPVSPDARRFLGLAPVFNHPGKTAAMDDIWRRRVSLLAGYLAATDKVAYCETIPFIGKITKFHLAKNFGADVAKPDVHLKRLADLHGTTAQALCESLSAASGYKARTVDLILWMACAKHVIDSRTGRFIERTVGP